MSYHTIAGGLCHRTPNTWGQTAKFSTVIENPSAEELQRLLSLVGFLEPLSEGALGELARSAHCSTLEAGEDFIVGPEEHGERMLLLLRGQVQVCEIDTSGRELTLAVLEYGVPIGATGLASRRMREMRLRALEPSVVCHLDQRDLERIVRDNPEVGLRLARLLGGRLNGAQSTKDVPERMTLVPRGTRAHEVGSTRGARAPVG